MRLSLDPWAYGRLFAVAKDTPVRFNFSIDGHSMTVIEADGVETDPVTVDQLQIFAGQFTYYYVCDYTDG